MNRDEEPLVQLRGFRSIDHVQWACEDELLYSD